ncbi:MAG: C40 family peptidase [Chitinophagales bacterium]|nr:C40 family peptidase [Chitinophagales bacterium]
MSMENGVVHISIAPQRKEPTHKSELVNQLLFGEMVEILEVKDNWSKVRNRHDQYEAWMQNSTFMIIDQEAPVNWDKFVYCGEVNAYVTTEDGPANLVLGSRFVDYSNNVFKMNQLVYHTYSEILVQTEKYLVDNVIKTAKMYLNCPYLWGGRSPFGIDCSGLTQMVFQLNNIQLLRDANQQETMGKKVALNKAEPGDLAFFHNEAGNVSHVGLILEKKWDELKIIHATDSAGKVRVDFLDKKGIFNKEKNTHTHNLHSIKRILKDENS